MNKLKSLMLKNFTTFSYAKLDFSPNINVIIGENGLGKTHILKSCYSILSVLENGKRMSNSEKTSKAYLQTAFANKLRGVFKPDEIGRLVKKGAGNEKAEVCLEFESKELNTSFEFGSTKKTEVEITKLPNSWNDTSAVFFPTRELLTLYPGFVSLYDTTHINFEETYRDTCLYLGSPLLKNQTSESSISILEKAMNGTVVLEDSGGFYLKTKERKIEMNLVAEGLRKLAMLARLISTGKLVENGYLFWDEPESNLNPAIIRDMAKVIFELSKTGIQIFIATHSLFLLRELELLQKTDFKDVGCRYFTLSKNENNVELESGNQIDELDNIKSLEEELRQTEQFFDLED